MFTLAHHSDASHNLTTVMLIIVVILIILVVQADTNVAKNQAAFAEFRLLTRWR